MSRLSDLEVRVGQTLVVYREYRTAHPVTGDYAFDLTLPYLETYAEMLHFLAGRRHDTPRLDEQLRSATEQAGKGE